jgi:thioredoxin 1
MSELIKNLTEDEFQVEVEHCSGYALVDFWAPWCGPCRMVGPVLEQLAEEYKGRLAIFKLNVDEANLIAAKYSISGIPALIMFHKGEPVGRIVGAHPKPQIKEFIATHIK